MQNIKMFQTDPFENLRSVTGNINTCVEVCSKQYYTLREQFHNIDINCKKLQSSIDTSNEKNNDLQKELSAIKKNNEELQKQVTALKKRNEELQNELSESGASLNETLNKNTELGVSLKEAQNEIKDIKTKLNLTRESKSETEKKLTVVRRSVLKVEKEKLELKIKLDEKINENGQLKSMIRGFLDKKDSSVGSQKANNKEEIDVITLSDQEIEAHSSFDKQCDEKVNIEDLDIIDVSPVKNNRNNKPNLSGPSSIPVSSDKKSKTKPVSPSNQELRNDVSSTLNVAAKAPNSETSTAGSPTKNKNDVSRSTSNVDKELRNRSVTATSPKKDCRNTRCSSLLSNVSPTDQSKTKSISSEKKDRSPPVTNVNAKPHIQSSFEVFSTNHGENAIRSPISTKLVFSNSPTKQSIATLTSSVEKSNRSSPASNINVERHNQSISAVSPTKASEDTRRSPISTKLVSSDTHLNQLNATYTSPGAVKKKNDCASATSDTNVKLQNQSTVITSSTKDNQNTHRSPGLTNLSTKDNQDTRKSPISPNSISPVNQSKTKLLSIVCERSDRSSSIVVDVQSKLGQSSTVISPEKDNCNVSPLKKLHSHSEVLPSSTEANTCPASNEVQEISTSSSVLLPEVQESRSEPEIEISKDDDLHGSNVVLQSQSVENTQSSTNMLPDKGHLSSNTDNTSSVELENIEKSQPEEMIPVLLPELQNMSDKTLPSCIDSNTENIVVLDDDDSLAVPNSTLPPVPNKLTNCKPLILEKSKYPIVVLSRLEWPDDSLEKKVIRNGKNKRKASKEVTPDPKKKRKSHLNQPDDTQKSDTDQSEDNNSPACSPKKYSQRPVKHKMYEGFV